MNPNLCSEQEETSSWLLLDMCVWSLQSNPGWSHQHISIEVETMECGWIFLGTKGSEGNRSSKMELCFSGNFEKVIHFLRNAIPYL